MGILINTFFVLIAGYTLGFTFASNVSQAFIDFDIVPDYISKAPNKLVEVTFGCHCCKTASLGNEITPKQARNEPKVSYETEEGQYYTVLMTNRDVPSRTNHSMGEYIYWIVGNVPRDQIKDGEVIVEYIGPAPLKGTCLHRYVILVYKQPNKVCFTETRLNNKSKAGRYYFNVRAFAEKYNFGVPVAGNFFLGQHDKFVDELDKRLGS